MNWQNCQTFCRMSCSQIVHKFLWGSMQPRYWAQMRNQKYWKCKWPFQWDYGIWDLRLPSLMRREDTSMLSATWDVKHKVWGILTTSYSATISYSEHSITCRLRNRAGYNFLYCSISCDACRRDVGFTVQPRLCKNAICTSKCISWVKIKICSECAWFMVLEDGMRFKAAWGRHSGNRC